MSHRIVKTRPAWVTRLGQLLAVLLLVGLCWAIFEYGRLSGGYDRETSRDALAHLQQMVQERDATITRLREEMAIQARSTQIEREAYKRLEGTVNELRGKLSELEEELTFYQGIISPGSSVAGLRVDDFEVVPASQNNVYRYKLVLTQVLNNSYAVSGKVDILLHGLADGEEKQFTVQELSADKPPSLKFRFKYFQNLEGDFVLPEGFRPGKIILKVTPSGKKYKRLEKSIDWPLQEKPKHVG